MSGESKKTPNEVDLLGYQLGLLDDDERREVAAACAANEKTARRCEDIEAWLAPLASDSCDVPAGLTGRIEARLDALRRPYETAAPETVAEGPVGSGHGGPFLSGRDLLALAAVITLFVGVFLPGYQQTQSGSQQATFANNLGTIARGLGVYGPSAADQYPFGGAVDVSYPGHLFRQVNRRHIPVGAVVNSGSREHRSNSDGASVERPNDLRESRNNRHRLMMSILQGPWVPNVYSLRTPIAVGMTPLVDVDRTRADDTTPIVAPESRR